ncbi:MAG: 2-alkenal reductase [Chloroflexi bacterium]|nr:MAG: 2-alkenal reductase [Chloroflexota bacterium]
MGVPSRQGIGRVPAVLCMLLLSLTLLAACSGSSSSRDDASTSATSATTDAVAADGTATSGVIDIAAVDPTATRSQSGQVATVEPTVETNATVEQVLSVADIVEKVNPAVVTVINQQRFSGFYNDGSDLQPAGSGTGFIISEDGYIVTNNHVVEGSQALQVIFENGDTVEATLVGTDPFTDLAVVKISGPVPATVPLGDSNALRPGDAVIAIGSALGEYTNTVTMGIVSGLGRSLQSRTGGSLESLIQHDAPINPGNSGGPLINMHGEVVGVNTAVVRTSSSGITAEGLGFAIPSDTVQHIATLLIEDGEVVRPFLGIVYQAITPRLASAENLPIDYGVLITEVPSGPARQAGVRQGDIITAIENERIDQDHPLVNILFKYKPGDTIDIEVYRPSTAETLTLEVTLGTRPSNT